MAEVIYINNLRVGEVNLSYYIPGPLTKVKYTKESGLPAWEGEITGELTGTNGSPTSQIPNVQYAERVWLGTNVTSIGDRAFRNCNGLTSVTIPASVTSIGNYAFYGCSGLTSVTIPDSVTSIGAYAFSNCSGLTSVNFGHGVTSIGQYAFYNCSGLTSVTIPDSVTSIGEGAFTSCNRLKNITFVGQITEIDAYAFAQCYICAIFDFRRSTNVPTLNNVSAFVNTPPNKEIIVPDSLYDTWISSTNWSSDTNNIRTSIVKASQSSLGSL